MGVLLDGNHRVIHVIFGAYWSCSCFVCSMICYDDSHICYDNILWLILSIYLYFSRYSIECGNCCMNFCNCYLSNSSLFYGAVIWTRNANQTISVDSEHTKTIISDVKCVLKRVAEDSAARARSELSAQSHDIDQSCWNCGRKVGNR